MIQKTDVRTFYVQCYDGIKRYYVQISKEYIHSGCNGKGCDRCNGTGMWETIVTMQTNEEYFHNIDFWRRHEPKLCKERDTEIMKGNIVWVKQ